MLPGSADNPELKILGRRRDASLANPRKPSEDRAIHDNKENIDFAKLDDSALLALRAQMRTRLERLAPHSVAHAELSARYDLSTQEIDDRARRAWRVIHGDLRQLRADRGVGAGEESCCW